MENSCQQNKATCYEVFPQEIPDPDTVPSLEAEIRKGNRERIARKRLEVQKKAAAKRSVVPTMCKLVHPSPQKYKKCQHSGNFVLDREVLNPCDHIDFIAMPRDKVRPKRPHYILQKLPSITNRIKTLARPDPKHVKATLEGYSDRLSQIQKHHLESLLEPKPFVTIPEAIGYAKQQRSDDAMWRRHQAKQKKKLMNKIHRWESQLLRDMMMKVSKQIRVYYLFANTMPLEENAARLSRAVLRSVCRFLDVPMPPSDGRTNPEKFDVIDDFYVEFSEKVGHWIWRMMETTGIPFDRRKSCSFVRKSESFVSVNSSVFELPLADDAVDVDPSDLEDLSIISLEIIHECLDEVVLEVENGPMERRNTSFLPAPASVPEEDATLAYRESFTEADINQHRISMVEDNVSTDQTWEEMDDNQVTVIENIQVDETDPPEDTPEEDKPPAS